jgi:hypothetical protein
MKSIAGSTSAGTTATKYKGWAIPIMRTTLSNINDIYQDLAVKKQSPQELVKTREFKEIIRSITSTSFLVMMGAFVIDQDDDTFLGQLKKRAYREALTFLQGIDPTMYLSTPRLLSFLSKFAENIKKIIMLEEYRQSGRWGRRGELKGVKGLQRQFTPSAIKQFTR